MEQVGPEDISKARRGGNWNSLDSWTGRQLPEAICTSLECKRSAAFFEEQSTTGSDAVETEGLLVQEKLPAGFVAIVVTMDVANVASCTSAKVRVSLLRRGGLSGVLGDTAAGYKEDVADARMGTSATTCAVPFVQGDGSNGALRDTVAGGIMGASKAILAVPLALPDGSDQQNRRELPRPLRSTR
jgi:hypothetical protein